MKSWVQVGCRGVLVGRREIFERGKLPGLWRETSRLLSGDSGIQRS